MKSERNLLASSVMQKINVSLGPYPASKAPPEHCILYSNPSHKHKNTTSKWMWYFYGGVRGI